MFNTYTYIVLKYCSHININTTNIYVFNTCTKYKLTTYIISTVGYIHTIIYNTIRIDILNKILNTHTSIHIYIIHNNKYIFNTDIVNYIKHQYTHI